MTSPQQRQTLLGLIQQACTAGASQERACAQVGLSERTVQRRPRPEMHGGDRRAPGHHTRAEPANKLSEVERQAAMAVLNGEEFKNLPPSQIVPRLADQGRYIASESTLYRLLHRAGQMAHRRLQRTPQKRSKPRALTATQADQIYCWDISYLPSQVRGNYFYLYLFVDLFSRKIVGWLPATTIRGLFRHAREFPPLHAASSPRGVRPAATCACHSPALRLYANGVQSTHAHSS